MNKKKLSILISTVDNHLLKNEPLLNIDTTEVDVVIVQQLINSDKPLSINKEDYTVFTMEGKGLSRSRNKAIDLAKTDWVYILDDDVSLASDFIEKVIREIDDNQDATGLTFCVNTPDGGFFKKYSSHKYMHNKKTVAKVSSIEMVINKQKLSGVSYDERFGLGATFATGEEFIFLSDLLKRKACLYFVPVVMTIHEKESSGKRYGNHELIKAKGAMFKRVFPFWFPIVLVAFSITKHAAYRQDVSFFSFVSFLFQGAKSLKNAR